MKVYISADMEGITGGPTFDQYKPHIQSFQAMSLEVAAAARSKKVVQQRFGSRMLMILGAIFSQNIYWMV